MDICAFPCIDSPWFTALMAARVGCHASVEAYRRICERFLDLRSIRWESPGRVHLHLPIENVAIRFDNAKTSVWSISCLEAASAALKISLLLNAPCGQSQLGEVWCVGSLSSPTPRRRHR